MKAKDLMTRTVYTCQPEQPCSEAARVMWTHDCGVVPVTDANGHVQGMLTDRDICMASLTQGKAVAEIAVSSAMSRSVRTCGEDDDARTLVTAMSRDQLRRIPVVDATGRVVGIVSLNDLARHALDGGETKELLDVARTLGQISQHRPVEVA
jgi:CBS domain-containing protein